MNIIDAYLLAGFYLSGLSSSAEHKIGIAGTRISKVSSDIWGYGPALGGGTNLYLLPWLALNFRLVYSLVQESCETTLLQGIEKKTCMSRDDMKDEDKEPDLYALAFGLTFAF